MKVGDLVQHESNLSGEPGLVVDVIQKKCWRTSERGIGIDWNKIEPEPHAVVLWSHNNGTIDIPLSELAIVNVNNNKN